ncbi:MAG: LamB/YcsF family protein [Acidobacteria bacterium ACB2]|nr:LamB/YcsF family protein [Acidobacteria bacterium ACB2]
MTTRPAPFLNCDLGEGAPDPDRLFMPWIAAANIACGGHAGDHASMDSAVRLAAQYAVRIGAHPSNPDRATFGRATIDIPADALEASLAAQIADLARLARAIGLSLSHVKPHGALYHDCNNPDIAAILARAATRAAPGAALVGPCGSRAVLTWKSMGLPVWDEAFADRLYLDDGSIAPRSTPGAVISDPDRAAAQALRIAQGHGAPTASGGTVPLRPTTICVHSDSPGAARTAQRVGAALRAISP